MISVSSDYPGKEDRANPHRSHCAEAGKEPFSFHKDGELATIWMGSLREDTVFERRERDVGSALVR